MNLIAAVFAAFCLVMSAQARADEVVVLRFAFADAPQEFTYIPGRAGMTRFSMLDAISIEGQAGAARLVVKFALPPDAGPGAQLLDARVTYRPDGFADFWQTVDIPAPEAFRFERVVLTGPRPEIAGRFNVALCPRVSIMRPADLEGCRMASGQFATHLQID